MDGDALATLLSLTPGPDSLKELVSKVGLRIKVYKVIKSLYDKESVSEKLYCLLLCVLLC